MNQKTHISSKYLKNADGKYVCPYCNITKTHMSTMHYHMKKHDPTQPFACIYCDKKFVYKQYLDLHYASKHTNEIKENRKYTCPYTNCDFHSNIYSNIRTHYMRIHCKDIVDSIITSCNEQTQFQCTICNNKYNNSTSFYYHAYTCVQPPLSHPAHDSYTLLVK